MTVIPTPASAEVVWTDAQLAKVYSTRAQVNPEHLTEGSNRGPCWLVGAPPFHVDEWFAKARDKSRHNSSSGWEEWVETILEGATHATPPMADLARRAIELYRGGDRPPALDLDVEVAMAELELQAEYDAFPFWVAAEGLPWALRALVRMHELANSEHDVHYHSLSEGLWLIETTAHAGDQVGECLSSWRLLRGLVAVADDETYQATRAVAAQVWDDASTAVRTALSFVFADEPGWAEEAARAYLDAGLDGEGLNGSGAATGMLVAGASPGLAARIVAGQPGSIDEPTLLTMLARLGPAAIPVLDAGLRHARSNDERLRYARVLAMIHTPEAARTLLAWRGNRRLASVIADYIAAVPDLAAAVPPPPAPEPVTDPTGIAFVKLLADYRTWYGENFARDLTEDLAEDEVAELADDGWLDPLGDLSPALEADIAALRERFGELPAGYLAFLRAIGPGSLLLPTDYHEPYALVLTHPANIPDAYASYQSWLHEEWFEENEGIDLAAMIPIMGEAVHANFVLLSRQHPDDDKVFLWRHDDEPYRMDDGSSLFDFLRGVIAEAQSGKGHLCL